MKTIDQVCDKILGLEGGFVNDPSDRGGPTQWGISLTFAKSLHKIDGKWPMDLNGDGVVDIQDIKLVTRDIAKGLYLKHFFYGADIDKLPVAVQPILFDMAVNGGAGGAARVLQMALVGLGKMVAIDGDIGAQTIGYAVDVQKKLGDKGFVNALVKARITYYQGIVRKNPGDEKFLKGWINRANEFAA